MLWTWQALLSLCCFLLSLLGASLLPAFVAASVGKREAKEEDSVRIDAQAGSINRLVAKIFVKQVSGLHRYETQPFRQAVGS